MGRKIKISTHNKQGDSVKRYSLSCESSTPISTFPKNIFFFLVTELRFELQQDIRSRSDRREWVSDEANPRCGFARNGGAKAGGFLSQTRLVQKTTRDATGPFKSHPRNQNRFHSRLGFGYGILLYIRKMPRLRP